MAFAIWCVIIAGVLPAATVGIAKWMGPSYDNARPRQWLDAQEGLPARADAAHRNHFEAFPLFAAAVILALMRQVSITQIDVLAGLFVVLRVLYTVCYLADRSNLRSLVWTAGFFTTMGLLYCAATA